MTSEATHLDFLDRFNEDLLRLACGARVAAIAGSLDEMEIVDLDGASIGRIPTRVDPDVFAASCLLSKAASSKAKGLRVAIVHQPTSPAIRPWPLEDRDTLSNRIQRRPG